MQQVTVVELRDLHDSVSVVDVREADEFRAGISAGSSDRDAKFLSHALVSCTAFRLKAQKREGMEPSLSRSLAPAV